MNSECRYWKHFFWGFFEGNSAVKCREVKVTQKKHQKQKNWRYSFVFSRHIVIRDGIQFEAIIDTAVQ